MIHSLSYLGLGSPKYQDWADFGTRVLGCELAARGADDAVRLRIDSLNYRLAIHPAEGDEIRYIGWDTLNSEGLAAFESHLREQGVAMHQATPDELAERQVAAMVWFTDMYGHRHEAAWGKGANPSTFNSPRGVSGFVTGPQGLGHFVLFVPNVDEADEHYRRILGMKLSDRIIFDGFNIRFYHVNGRHHTMAIGEMPGMTGMHHIMLEVENFADVGKAIDIITDESDATPIVLSLGQHTNDRMVSFYCDTPSSVKIEYGHGGYVIRDEAQWVVQTYSANSIWGHRPTEALFKTVPGILTPVKS